MSQSYQEVSKIIKVDLKRLSNKKLNEINFQEYFYEKQNKNPKRYERIVFDTNSEEPYSSALARILSSLRVSHFLYSRLYVNKKQ